MSRKLGVVSTGRYNIIHTAIYLLSHPCDGTIRADMRGIIRGNNYNTVAEISDWYMCRHGLDHVPHGSREQWEN